MNWLEKIQQSQWKLGSTITGLDAKSDALYEIGMLGLAEYLAKEAQWLREIQDTIAEVTSDAIQEICDIGEAKRSMIMSALLALAEKED